MGPVDDSLLCAVDTSGFQILPYEQWLSIENVVEDTLHPLSLHDFEKVECLLAKEVDSWNADLEQHYSLDDRIELNKYGRQYCALTNEQGHRLVYLNAFCSSGTRPIKDRQPFKGWNIVSDGGHCYFQALFDIDLGSVVHFSFNGEA